MLTHLCPPPIHDVLPCPTVLHISRKRTCNKSFGPALHHHVILKRICHFSAGINQSFVDRDRSGLLRPKAAIWVTENTFNSYKFHLLKLLSASKVFSDRVSRFDEILSHIMNKNWSNHHCSVPAGWKEASREGGRMCVNMLSPSNVTLRR